MSWVRPLIWTLLVIGGAGTGLWWLNTRPVTYVDDRGFSVDFPHGWEIQKVDGEILAHNPFRSDGQGSAKVTVHPHLDTADWPAEGLRCFGAPVIKWHEETQIDEKRGLLAVFDRDAQKFVGVIADRGDVFIVWVATCDAEFFDNNRSYFERCGSGTRCNPKK